MLVETLAFLLAMMRPWIVLVALLFGAAVLADNNEPSAADLYQQYRAVARNGAAEEQANARALLEASAAGGCAEAQNTLALVSNCLLSCAFVVFASIL